MKWLVIRKLDLRKAHGHYKVSISMVSLCDKTTQSAITRSKLTIETLEQGVKFDYVSHLVLLFLLLTLNMKLPAGYMQTFRFDSHDKHGK